MTKTIDLSVTSRVGSYSRDKIERSIEQEKSMVAQDLQETERLTAKNSVEEYIYGIREKIGTDLETYLTEDDRCSHIFIQVPLFEPIITNLFINLSGPSTAFNLKMLKTGFMKMERMLRNLPT